MKTTRANSTPAASTKKHLALLKRKGLLSEATARDARLWASPEYVEKQEAAAQTAWVRYWAASTAQERVAARC